MSGLFASQLKIDLDGSNIDTSRIFGEGNQ